MSTAASSKAQGDDFPIVCETCLGPNPYVRMQKHKWGSQCKVCERPFTSFRWRPAGAGTRPKKTEICQTCARAKNVCQTCLLDLQFGLPVQVRDASMAAGDRQRTVVPKSDGTREYAAAQSERAIETGDIDAIYNAPMVNDIAEKAKRAAPRYERNRARICTFFLKGSCTRGLYCPYRHEKPDETAEDTLTDQNLRDRYYGVNDPVAGKILRKAGVTVDGTGKVYKIGKRGNGPPPPPDDPTIQTLFIGGVDEVVKERDLQILFSNQPGLSRISLLANKGIAFTEFETRKDAESALKNLYGQHEINGARVVINWGRGNNRTSRSVVSKSTGQVQQAKAPEMSPSAKKHTEPNTADYPASKGPNHAQQDVHPFKASLERTESKKRTSTDLQHGAQAPTPKKASFTIPSVSDKPVVNKAAPPPTKMSDQ